MNVATKLYSSGLQIKHGFIAWARVKTIRIKSGNTLHCLRGGEHPEHLINPPPLIVKLVERHVEHCRELSTGTADVGLHQP